MFRVFVFLLAFAVIFLLGVSHRVSSRSTTGIIARVLVVEKVVGMIPTHGLPAGMKAHIRLVCIGGLVLLRPGLVAGGGVKSIVVTGSAQVVVVLVLLLVRVAQ